MKQKKVIVMSVDAMVYEDLRYAQGLPVFGTLLREGARVNRVRTIYPSITYPAHVSIASGAYPDKHGVIANEVLTIGAASAPWNWFHNVVKCQDLFDAAKAAGLRTAAVFWPVTGNHPSIDYLVDEYWPQNEADTPEAVFLRSGTTPEVYARCVAPYMNGLRIRSHPETDHFVVNCACDMIRAYQPDLLMLHPSNIDAYRHQSGLFSDKITQGLNEVERWLDQLITATKNAGVFEDTVFVVLSDHGMLNISRVVHLNVLLREAGFLKTDSAGNITSWDAWCLSVGLSAQVYLRDPSDPQLYRRVQAFLQKLKDDEVYGIGEIFTREQIHQREHLDGDFSFILETDGYTSFGNAWNRPLVRSFSDTDYRYGRATHGHLPSKGPQPTFLLWGPGVNPQAGMETCAIVDEAPTIAKLLGLSLPQADGRCLDSLLSV